MFRQMTFFFFFLYLFMQCSIVWAAISNTEAKTIQLKTFESISGVNTSSKWKVKRLEIFQTADAMEIFAEYNGNHYLIAIHKTSKMISLVYKTAPSKTSSYEKYDWRSVKNTYKQIPLTNNPTSKPISTPTPILKSTPTPNIIPSNQILSKQLDPQGKSLPITSSKPSNSLSSSGSSKNILSGTAKQECKNLAKFISWTWLYLKCT